MKVEWAGIKIPKSLAERIDECCKAKTEFGIPMFDSRADFVEKACIDYLKTCKIYIELAQQPAEQKT